ncbi:MAG: hypothetical protein RL230_223 [Pseudomonadota bacterium]|jgi:hypothetical protein
MALFHPNGLISSGAKLGVSIGADRKTAREQIERKGMEFQRSQRGGICFFRQVSNEFEVDVFFVDTWHGGMVCLLSKNGHIRQLIWAFQPVSF